MTGLMWGRRLARSLRRRQPVRILVVVLILLITIPNAVVFIMKALEERRYHLYRAPDNAFYEITVPSQFQRPESKNFKYGDLLKSANNGKCLERNKARHEFVRILGKNLRAENLATPHMLIVGASTALGAAISRKFSYKGVPFIAINGINELDFSSKDAEIAFENVTIAKAFITYQPPLTRHATTDGSQYLNKITSNYIDKLTSFLNRRGVPFVFAPTGPISEETMSCALRNGGCVVELPLLIDSMAFHDLENPMLRAVRECRKAGRSIIDVFPGASVHSMTANEASKFVRKQIKHDDDLKKGRFRIYGNTNVSVKEAVKIALEAAGYDNCNIVFREYPHKIEQLPPPTHTAMVGGEDADVRSMVRQAFNNFTRQESETPYFSIVLVGRHDNFSAGFEVRAQNCLDTINAHLDKVPLANIEIVFVDYATPIAKKPLLEKVLNVGNNLRGRMRYIIVPEQAHKHILSQMATSTKISFLEYVAKNIGIRRSRGKFVLTTNPDDLLSVNLFELIASHQFNTALVYRAQRWDNRENTSYTIQDLARGTSEPWEMQRWNVNQRCRPRSPLFSIIDSRSSYDVRVFLCGAGDFLLLSKKFWDAVEGFNEFPANPNVDALLSGRLMKLVPGYAQMIMYPLILHQRHPKKNIFRPSVVNMSAHVDDYICTGRCPSCGRYADTDNWGASDTVFREILVS